MLTIADSKFTAEVPKVMPNNLKIVVNKQTETKGKRQTSSMSNHGFLWKLLMSIVALIGGLSAITITIIFYLLDYILSNLNTKFNCLIISSIVIAIIVDMLTYNYSNTLFVNLFKIHSH